MANTYNITSIYGVGDSGVSGQVYDIVVIGTVQLNSTGPLYRVQVTFPSNLVPATATAFLSFIQPLMLAAVPQNALSGYLGTSQD